MKRITTLALLLFSLLPMHSWSMGLRAFVAMPIEPGGAVLRFIDEHVEQTDKNTLTTNLAYGISGTQTLFMQLPYRMNPSGGHRAGDFGLTYRHNLYQNFSGGKSTRFGMLAGVVLPTDDDRDTRVRAGGVMTHAFGRHEFDIDAIWTDGLGNMKDMARYDLSWQYRLSPTKLPDWDPADVWNGVIELGGRWTEGNETVHQLTFGLQWISNRLMIEGGIVEDLNGPDLTRFLIGTRIRF